MKDKAVKSIRFPQEIDERVREQAKEQDRTFSGQVISLLKYALSQLDARGERLES
jgi:hypothetical protein